jgi:preprotein translocase subunit SecD
VAASSILDEEQSTEQRPVDDSYTAIISEAVVSIELQDGSKLRLARESYDVSDEGAESLQSDLSELLDAETVSVSIIEAQGALFIEVTACKQELATCNGTIEFLSATDESATQQEVRNLEKELISAGKKLTAMNHANTGGKVKELKAELQKINNQIYAISAGKSGGRTLGNKPVTIGANAGRDEENGAGFLTGVIKNYHSNNQ